MSHYNNKKELLLQSQEEVTELRLLVQQREDELQAAATRSQLLQLEVEQVRSSEKKLLGSVASLEAQVSRSSSRFSWSPQTFKPPDPQDTDFTLLLLPQLAFADRNLRAHTRIQLGERASTLPSYLELPEGGASTLVVHPPQEKKSISPDSLNDSSLEDLSSTAK